MIFMRPSCPRASRGARGEGPGKRWLEPKVTSDAEHVEIGLTDKSDSARAVLAELWADGISADQVLIGGDEFVPLGGLVAGLVTLGRLRSVPAARRATTRVSEIAWPVADLTIADPDELILDVLRRSAAGGDGRILACNDDTVVGIVSPTDITRALQFADIERMH